jgi:hypothetical protein
MALFIRHNCGERKNNVGQSWSRVLSSRSATLIFYFTNIRKKVKFIAIKNFFIVLFLVGNWYILCTMDEIAEKSGIKIIAEFIENQETFKLFHSEICTCPDTYMYFKKIISYLNCDKGNNKVFLSSKDSLKYALSIFCNRKCCLKL